MTFSVTTWNINSVRLRMPIVEQFLVRHQPDVLCLQETKVENSLFPFQPLRALGYEHIIIHGVPVQFLPAHNALAEAAVATARTIAYEDVLVRVIAPEHLAARLTEVTDRAGDQVPKSGSAQGTNEVGKAMAARR